jgi:gas vesicle protein GvpL/GvpF
VSDAELARWAERQAEELIAQAQAGAFDAARARLQARLTDALVEAAERRLAAPEPKPDPEPGTLLWVYGIVPASFDGAPSAGVDGLPVTTHSHAGISALVSEVPRAHFDETALSARLEDVEDLGALARAHEAVLQAALATGAVLPFRLCTIYSSAERLDAMLERERTALTAALGRVTGMHEWGVKAFLRKPDPAAVPAASGAEYLDRMRARRDAVDAGDTVVAEIHARLTERAAAAALGRPHDRRLSGRDAEMALNAAYLVPEEGASAFRDFVDELGRRHDGDGVELELTGPWPAHHFVETPEG